MPKTKTAKKRLVRLASTLYADKGTYDKVHRHLTDINDTITDEDIENISTDIVVKKIHEAARIEQAAFGNDKADNGRRPAADLSEENEEKMYEEGEKITSPWNIISE